MLVRGVVDRLENEGKLVVVETQDKKELILKKELFLEDVHVNDVVYETENGLWRVDKEKTESRLKEVLQLISELWEKGDDMGENR